MNLATSLFLLLTTSSTTTAITTARIWTHFHPNCPSESSKSSPFTSFSTFSPTTLPAPSTDIHRNQCVDIPTPSIHRGKVDHLSMAAELLWTEPFEKCNVTVHEVAGCVDPGLLTMPMNGRTAVSPCVARKLAAFSSVWVRLECEDFPVRESEGGGLVHLTHSSKAEDYLDDEENVAWFEMGEHGDDYDDIDNDNDIDTDRVHGGIAFEPLVFYDGEKDTDGDGMMDSDTDENDKRSFVRSRIWERRQRQ